MAGLLDTFFGNADQTQALGLLGASLASGKGFGPAAGLAMQHLAGADDRKLKRGLLDMQMQNYASEIEARKAKAAQQQKLMELAGRLTAGQRQPSYQQGQLGSGTFGAMPTAPGVDPMQPAVPGASGIGAADLNDLAAFRALGGEDMLPYYKAANEGFERKPGSFYDIPGRGRTFIPDVKAGMDYQGGRVTPIPGYTDFLTQQTLAQEVPKAVMGAAGRVALRKNPDGTESPVVELNENPVLSGMFSRMFGGQPTPSGQPAQPGPVAPQPRPAAGAGGPSNRVSPDAQKAADAESIRMIKSELQNPAIPPSDRAAMERELQRLTASQSMPGFPTPTLIRPGQGYGRTTAQTAQEDAAAAGMKAKAEADARAAAERQAGKVKKSDSANDMMNNIFRARTLLESGATGSLIGAGADAALGVFGGSTATSRNADALETISGWLVSNVPRMEGPQSNYDVQNYKTMAARVGDRTYPIEGRLAALAELENIQRKYTGQPGGAAPTQPPQQSSGKRFESKPPAQAYKGKFMTDEATGERYQSNGMSWVKVK